MGTHDQNQELEEFARLKAEAIHEHRHRHPSEPEQHDWAAEEFQRGKEPVERIKEIVKEVEVPAKLTASQQDDIDLGARYRTAINLSDSKKIFRNMGPVSVHVHINGAAKEVISAERLKNKFELILRKYSIPMKDTSLHFLWFDIESVSIANAQINMGLGYQSSISLYEAIVAERPANMYRVGATLWRDGATCVTSLKDAEGAILKEMEERAESFANAYLAAQQ